MKKPKGSHNVLLVATFVGSLKENNKNHTLVVHLLLLVAPNDL